MGSEDRGPTVTDREILAVFANFDDEPLRAETVADELPMAPERLRDRLEDLYEQGLLERETSGIPDEQWRLDPAEVDEEDLPDESRVETDTEAQATKATGAEAPTTAEETPETEPPDPQETVPEPLHERMPDAIQAFAPPGTPEEKERRRGALHRAYLYLQRRERARRSDFENDVFPEAPGGYEGPDEGWWDEVVRPGLDALPDAELVDGGDEGAAGVEGPAGEEAVADEEVWVYTGEKPADVPE